MLTCFEFRVGGRGKRRGFIHVGCATCSYVKDGETKQFTMEDELKVQVPEGDLAGEACVVCQQPMVAG